MARLTGKAAIITGAGMGLGRETAMLMAANGARVAVADLDADAARETVELIKRAEGEAVAVIGDATCESDVRRMIDEGAREMGGLNVLDANLGVLWRDRDRSVLDIEEASWDGVFDRNLKPAVWLAKHGIPHLKRAGGGSIVLIGSVSGLIGVSNSYDGYVTAKGALRALNRSLSIQFAPDNIRSNIIHPGTMDTPMQAGYLTPALRAQAEANIPLGRIAHPREIAYAALFLASDESSYMTGAEMVIDGGYTAQ